MTYHFAMVRIKSLVDQRKLLTAEAALQVQHVAKNPRFVLSSQKIIINL